MAERTPYIGGNWKMNLHRVEAVHLAEQIAEATAGSVEAAGVVGGGVEGAGGGTRGVEVALCPPFPYLAPVAEALAAKGSAIKVGAQDCYHQPNGAFTGEVSLSQIKDVGARVVILGHSERRHVIGERDETINAKVLAALDAGLEVILCIGETLAQREANKTHAINAAQLSYGLAGVPAEQVQNVVIAYEPVWAIGTGHTATPEDAQNAHAACRCHLAGMFSDEIAKATRLQYGGSMKAKNAGELLAQPDIDGGLIGGASLKADEFTAIVEAAG